ncbi:aromatic acid exporter family protein [Streptococcus didelphis]|uniref:Aromatic acid exporter family protein n=1 Tax=Streptococcus didelphis TaxID=102886 RepID=A0ABY9LHB7_9STRE|nr:aromatic acid exporter family protein [Streptococcus didelphis]WMB28237.1 aromatic acid exporter family protein [Streptococcus didelphis]WMB28911.1 aromatic acid exporter family protein [Streptococcus didelphis]
MKLFERTVKMVLATCLAIIVADLLNLKFSTSAGIIALLSLLDTRQYSLKIARDRLISFILSFMLAYSIFLVFGFGLFAFTLYLVITIPLLYYLKIESGLVPITVLVSHLLTLKSLNPSVLLNEALIFVIGTGFALLLNTYMTSNSGQIKTYQKDIEKRLKEILFQLEASLLAEKDSVIEVLVQELEFELEQALKMVYRESDNQVFQQTNYQVHYFEMRRNQVRLLKQIVKISQNIKEKNRESVLLAHFIHETASQLSEKNPAVTLLDDIASLLQTYRQRELPKTRLEFENRAQLFQLLQDLENFIREKTEFYQEYHDLP